MYGGLIGTVDRIAGDPVVVAAQVDSVVKVGGRNRVTGYLRAIGSPKRG